MNKPITTRVQQAVNGNRGVQEPLLHVGVATGNAAKRKGSPLKKNNKPSLGGMFEGTTKDIPESLSKVPTFQTYSAADAITDSAEKPVKDSTETKKESTSNGLAEGAANVAGTTKKNTIPKATEVNANESAESKKPGFTGSTSIGAAFQRNMAARIDKAGELGRARRDARRAKRSAASVNAEKAGKAKEERKVERDMLQNTTLSTKSLEGSNDDSNTEADNFNPGFKNIKKSGVMSVPVDKVGPPKPASAPSVDASKLPNASSLGSSTGNYTNNRSNEGSGKTTRDNRGVGDFYNTQEAFKQGSVDKEKLTLGSESAESAVKMRMNSNVGIKSKSPMKKGYFKGM